MCVYTATGVVGTLRVFKLLVEWGHCYWWSGDIVCTNYWWSGDIVCTSYWWSGDIVCTSYWCSGDIATGGVGTLLLVEWGHCYWCSGDIVCVQATGGVETLCVFKLLVEWGHCVCV